MFSKHQHSTQLKWLKLKILIVTITTLFSLSFGVTIYHFYKILKIIMILMKLIRENEEDNIGNKSFSCLPNFFILSLTLNLYVISCFLNSS